MIRAAETIDSRGKSAAARSIFETRSTADHGLLKKFAPLGSSSRS